MELQRGFQSHAGSIEASGSYSSLPGRQPGFNPTLVRLRPIIQLISAVGFPGFNPTLVRLRLVLSGGAMSERLAFQSHAGSIEAVQVSSGGEFGQSFNPTLVRLRPRLTAKVVLPVPPCFNPTLVRLRRPTTSEPPRC